MADELTVDPDAESAVMGPDAVPLRPGDGTDEGRTRAGGPDAGGPDGGGADGGSDVDEAPSGGIRWPVVALAVVLAGVVGIAGVLIYQKATTPGAGSVDVGFMQDMTTHHQQAIEMASIAAEHASDPDVRAFAREVLISQEYEIGYMEALLEDWGEWPFPQDRTAMAWMGMASTPAQMPGMQSEAEITRMQQATGLDVDTLFLQMMTDHHRGGVHMAEYAATHASDPRVRDLASRMAKMQRGEIADYQRAADRLGIHLDD